MLRKISTILKNLQVDYNVTGVYSTYEIGNIQERRVATAFNLAANGEFRALTTENLFPGDHVKNRDYGDIIIVRCDTNEVVANIDLKVATFSTDPDIYGPVNMSSAYKFAGWHGDRVNTFYMLVNGGRHDKVKFINVNTVRELLDTGGKVRVLRTKNLMTSNHISPEEYAAKGWDKNLLGMNGRNYLVDEDYIAAKDLASYTSDFMC
jgi:hypothetical protein